jgi:phosphatidylinositol glycan class B
LDAPVRTRVLLAAASLAVLALQSWHSQGYYHQDEYFQTIEFASYKLGTTPAADLAWEFPARIRPFFQPAIDLQIMRGLRAVGLSSPGAALLAIRLLSGLTGWIALLLLWRALAPRLPDDRSRTWLLAALLFTWYIPFVAVRTSSESLSGSLLAAALAAFLLLESRPALAALVSGALLGLSFDARYQIALAAVGFGAWLLFVRRPGLGAVAALVLGFALTAGLGLVLDRWGYGAWTFTPWNYLRVNLFEGMAASMGVEPFWFYPADLAALQAPLSTALLVAAVVFCVKAPRHPITWITAAFFLGHCVLAHKVSRFLFPVAPLAAAMVPLLILDPSIRTGWLAAFLDRPRVKRLFPVLVALDLLFLIGLYLVPIRHELSVQLAARELTQAGQPVLVIGPDPFVDVGVKLTYLRPPGWSPEVVKSWAEVEARVASESRPIWVVSLLGVWTPDSLRAGRQLAMIAGPVPEPVASWLQGPIGRTKMRGLWKVGP